MLHALYIMSVFYRPTHPQLFTIYGNSLMIGSNAGQIPQQVYMCVGGGRVAERSPSLYQQLGEV